MTPAPHWSGMRTGEGIVARVRGTNSRSEAPTLWTTASAVASKADVANHRSRSTGAGRAARVVGAYSYCDLHPVVESWTGVGFEFDTPVG